MSRMITVTLPKSKQTKTPKTAALAKAQADHKAWLKKHGIKVTGNALKT